MTHPRPDTRATAPTLMAWLLAYGILSVASSWISPHPWHSAPWAPQAGIALGLVACFGPRVAWIPFTGTLVTLFLWNPLSLPPGARLLDAAVLGGTLAFESTFGAWLLHRAGVLSLRTPSAALRFLLLAGPVRATPTLGLIALSRALSGDALEASEVLVLFSGLATAGTTALVVLALHGEMGAASRGRLLLVALPQIALTGVVVLAVQAAEGAEKVATQRSLAWKASRLATAVAAEAAEAADLADDLAAFAEAATPRDRASFQRYASPLRQRDPALQALEWIPRVPDAERSAFEAAMLTAGYAEFAMTEKRDGVRVPSSARADHFPVAFVEPLAGNEAAVGFDLASEPSRLAAMEAARAERKPTATAPVRLVQGCPDGGLGTLVFAPAFDATGPLLGYGLGVFCIGQLVDTALAVSGADPNTQIAYAVYDVTGGETTQVYPPAEPGAPGGLRPPAQAEVIGVAGRHFAITATAPAGPITGHTAAPAGVAGIGAALVLLLAALGLLHTGRIVRDGEQAARRNLALRAMEVALNDALHDRVHVVPQAHRQVGRNLALVTTLLTLEEARIQEPNRRATWVECRLRIQAVALLHGRLVDTPEFRRVDMAHCLTDLCSELKCGLGRPDVEIIGRAPAHLTFPHDRALAVAQVVTELVIRAVRQGFPENRAGTISVSLEPETGGFDLVVSHSEAGVAEGEVPEASPGSLGMDGVASVAARLGGTVDIASPPGARTVRLRFPASA